MAHLGFPTQHWHARACRGKRRHAALADATDALHKMEDKTGAVFNVYLCRWCLGYHIGHEPGAYHRAS